MGCSYEYNWVKYHFNSDIKNSISHLTYTPQKNQRTKILECEYN